MDAQSMILAALGATCLGLGAVVFVRSRGEKGRVARILEEAARETARLKAEAEVAAKSEILRMRESFDQEGRGVRAEAEEVRLRAARREEELERRLESLAKKERFLEKAEQSVSERRAGIEKREKELEAAMDAEQQTLQRLAALTKEQAQAALMKRLEEEMAAESAALIDRVQREAREQAQERSREILANAIQRYASEHTAEHVVSSLALPNDEAKGRIIGREGRNIRSFEKATGVTVIVDDTPNTVILSSFDPIRRELAKRALEKLIVDGRINPARIEELVASTKEELDKIILESGKQAVYAVGVHGLDPKEVALLGRLNYRTTYGQNVLEHSMEVSQLCATVAGELGLDAALAKRIGLLHDVGKALDHEVEGSHAAAGAEFLKRCGENATVVNAVAAHHGEAAPGTAYAVILDAVNKVSGKRPGARKDNLDRLVKRMQKLEETAKSVPGVREAFAIQSGREIRVMVDPSKVDDRGVAKLCRDIAMRIRAEMSYPGEVQVTALREFRGQGVAH